MTASSIVLDGESYHLTFNDDFNSLSAWQGHGSSGIWSSSFSPHLDDTRYLAPNGEGQYYADPDMATLPQVYDITNGVLSINAHELTAAQQAEADGQHYVSGLITTEMTFAASSGYMEISADVPDEQGFLSAFWLLPNDDDWSSEIDVFEILGHDADTLHTNVWQNGVGDEESFSIAGLADGFHTYGLHWTEDSVTWLVDGTTVRTEQITLTDDMFLALSLAVDTTWTGAPDATTDFSDPLRVDYVRVYELSSDPDSNPAITPGGFVPQNGYGGTAANDDLYGTRWADTLTGAAGDDIVYGRKGHDQLSGGTGADEVLGQKGNDLIVGNDGDDKLVGGAGEDILEGGAGTDHLWGGRYNGSETAEDRFVFSAGSGKDFVHDFDAGEDVIDLTAMNTDWATISPLLQDQGWATYLNFGSLTGSYSDMVFLIGTDAANLSAADFDFGVGV